MNPILRPQVAVALDDKRYGESKRPGERMDAAARGNAGSPAGMSAGGGPPMSTKLGRLIVLAVLTLLVTGVTAAGQTTRPSTPFTAPAPAAPATSDDAAPAGDWPLVVRKFAETLCAEAGSAANVAALRPLVR